MTLLPISFMYLEKVTLHVLNREQYTSNGPYVLQYARNHKRCFTFDVAGMKLFSQSKFQVIATTFSSKPNSAMMILLIVPLLWMLSGIRSSDLMHVKTNFSVTDMVGCCRFCWHFRCCCCFLFYFFKPDTAFCTKYSTY